MTYELLDIDESFTQLQTNDIEFKKKVIDTLSVFEEGYKYSPLFRAGVWDGKKYFYTIEPNTNIQFPKGLVKYIVKDLQKNNLSYTYNPISSEYNILFDDFKEFISTLNLPFEPYDYQVKAAYESIKYKRMVLRSATGSGKSLILYMFIRYMLSKDKHILLVVPSINLVNQMYTDFEEYGFEDVAKYAKQIGGDHKGNKDLAEKPLVISTWQSLYKMTANNFEIFDCILVDEAHTVKGEALQGIINNSKNSQWKIGCTGTVPRTKVEKLTLLGALGYVNKIITAGGLIKLGLATPTTINALYLNYSHSDRDELNKGKKPDYAKETKFIESHYYRNKKVSQIISKLANKGNVLALFSHIEHGEKLLKYCIEERTGEKNLDLLHKITPKPLKEAFEKWQKNNELKFYMNTPITDKDIIKINKNLDKFALPEDAIRFRKRIYSLDDINIFFVTGKVDGNAREYIRKNLETVHASETGQGAIVLGGYSILSTGVNYKNLHNIVYASSLKSYTKIVQSIGRGLRLHKSKSRTQIFDCVDVLSSTNAGERPNYALKHFFERIEYYREDEYEITEKEIILEGDNKAFEIKSFDEEW
jgi:superfamily II DNA or RNA helicase